MSGQSAIKCIKINISDVVMHEGKKKTVIGVIVGHVFLTEKTWQSIYENQLAGNKANFEYGPWIDLDDVTLIDQ